MICENLQFNFHTGLFQYTYFIVNIPSGFSICSGNPYSNPIPGITLALGVRSLSARVRDHFKYRKYCLHVPASYIYRRPGTHDSPHYNRKYSHTVVGGGKLHYLRMQMVGNTVLIKLSQGRSQLLPKGEGDSPSLCKWTFSQRVGPKSKNLDS